MIWASRRSVSASRCASSSSSLLCCRAAPSRDLPSVPTAMAPANSPDDEPDQYPDCDQHGQLLGRLAAALPRRPPGSPAGTGTSRICETSRHLGSRSGWLGRRCQMPFGVGLVEGRHRFQDLQLGFGKRLYAGKTSDESSGSYRRSGLGCQKRLLERPRRSPCPRGNGPSAPRNRAAPRSCAPALPLARARRALPRRAPEERPAGTGRA